MCGRDLAAIRETERLRLRIPDRERRLPLRLEIDGVRQHEGRFLQDRTGRMRLEDAAVRLTGAPEIDGAARLLWIAREVEDRGAPAVAPPQLAGHPEKARRAINLWGIGRG